MTKSQDTLQTIFDGWNGYHQSIVNAVAPLTQGQLAWRPADNFNSVGELVRHISLGRVTWCLRMGAPGSTEIASQIHEWERDSDDNRDVVEKSIDITGNAAELVRWLDTTWQMIDKTLNTWTILDLAQTYKHTWNGQMRMVESSTAHCEPSLVRSLLQIVRELRSPLATQDTRASPIAHLSILGCCVNSI